MLLAITLRLDIWYSIYFRTMVETVGGIRRPLIDLTRVNWGIIFNRALKTTLIPPFNPYENSLNFLLAAYTMPYLAQVSYVNSIPSLTTNSPSLFVSIKNCDYRSYM